MVVSAADRDAVDAISCPSGLPNLAPINILVLQDRFKS